MRASAFPFKKLVFCNYAHYHIELKRLSIREEVLGFMQYYCTDGGIELGLA